MVQLSYSDSSNMLIIFYWCEELVKSECKIDEFLQPEDVTTNTFPHLKTVNILFSIVFETKLFTVNQANWGQLAWWIIK